MGVAVTLWLLNRLKSNRVEKLKTQWQSQVLALLSEGRQDWRPLKIDPKDALDFVDYLLGLSRRIRGESTQELNRLAAPHLSLVAMELKTGDPAARAWAAQALGTFGLPGRAADLRKALNDRAPLVVMMAFHGLVAHGALEDLDALLMSLKKFKGWNPNLLSSALVGLGAPATAVIRKKYADASLSPHVRTILALALVQLNDIKAGPIAAHVLSTEKDVELCVASLRLVRIVGTPEYLPLIRALCASQDFPVRAQAMGVLGQMGSKEDLSILWNGFNDASSWVAGYAAKSLKDAGGEQLLQQAIRGNHARALLARQVLMESA